MSRVSHPATTVATRTSAAAPTPTNLETFSDDFENNDLTVNWPTRTGSPAIASGSKKNGSLGLHLAPSAAAKYVGSGTGKWGQTHPYASFGMNFRFTTLPTASNTAEILTIANTANVDNFDFYIQGSSNHFMFDLKQADAVTVSWAPVAGTWYHLQGLLWFGGATYTARVAIDGVEQTFLTSAGHSTQSVRSVIIGCTDSETFDLDVDDFVLKVADTEIGWIG